MTKTTEPGVAHEVFHEYPEILTLEDVAEILRCKKSTVYEMSRHRSQLRYKNPLRFLRLPCGLRVRKQDLIDWLDRLAEEAQVNGTRKC